MYAAVAMSVVASATFALGAPLSRFALPVSAGEVTLGRLVLAAAAAMLAALFLRQPLRQLWRPRTVALGAVLYAHFHLFTLAAQTTTTAHALAIVYTSPLLVALGSRVVLREPPRPAQVAGVLAAVAGIAVLVGFEPAKSGASAAGDLAALGSAVALAAYVIVGRSWRAKVPLAAYVAGAYGWAAVFAVPAAVVAFDPTAYDVGRIAAIAVLGLVPLGLGHTLLNAALRRVPATIPNVITTQEVTGGVILSAFMFGEIPGLNALVGGIVALAGVIAVVAFAKPPTTAPAAPP